MVPPCPYIMRMVAIRHTRGAKKYNLLLLRGRHHRCCSGGVVITQNYPLNCFWVSFTSANVVEIWAAYSSKYIFFMSQTFALSSFFSIKKIWHDDDWLRYTYGFFLCFTMKCNALYASSVAIDQWNWNWNDGEDEINEQ